MWRCRPAQCCLHGVFRVWSIAGIHVTTGVQQPFCWELLIVQAHRPFVLCTAGEATYPILSHVHPVGCSCASMPHVAGLYPTWERHLCCPDTPTCNNMQRAFVLACCQPLTDQGGLWSWFTDDCRSGVES